MELDKYLPFADQPTPKAQEGEWTLIAPDGRRFTGPSPIHCAGAESKTRFPPHVALGRIARGMQEPLAAAPEPNEQKEGAHEAALRELVEAKDNWIAVGREHFIPSKEYAAAKLRHDTAWANARAALSQGAAK